jgi:hypothetical protein
MSIQEIADGQKPPLPNAIRISFVTPSGCMAIPVKDGGLACRTFKKGSVLHLDDPSDGLIAEMRSGREPLPWFNAEERKDAIDQIRNGRSDLDDTLRDDLIAWVEATAWYER